MTGHTHSVTMGGSHFKVSTPSLAILVALDKGFYDEAKIDLDPTATFSGGIATTTGFREGKFDIGRGSPPACTIAYQSGVPIRIFARCIRTPIDVLTTPDSDIETIQDLAGAVVGYSNQGSASQSSIAICLDRADGISIDDVDLRAMGGLTESITGLEKGDIDASWSTDTVSVPGLATGRFNRVFATWEYIPEYATDVFYTSQHVIENRPEMLRRFVEVQERGNRFIREHTEESATIWAQEYPAITQETALEILEMELEAMPDYFGVSFGETLFSLVGEGLVLSGELDPGSIPEWNDVVTQDFLPPELQVDLP